VFVKFVFTITRFYNNFSLVLFKLSHEIILYLKSVLLLKMFLLFMQIRV